MGKRLLVLALMTTAVWAQPVFVDSHYTADFIYAGNGMTVIDLDQQNRLFAGEKQGRILVFQPDGSGGFLAPTVFADLTSAVDDRDESGLLGMALDPQFLSNRHIFLFYTTNTDQRLVRWTANNSFTAVEPGSELVLLSGLPRLTTIHKAGDIEFHPNDDQTIFIALGDDDQGHLPSNGTTRPQDPDTYIGKILRVSKDNGQGLSDNPFWDGNPNSVRSRVWAVGFRNPFRIAFHPTAPVPDVLYNSENGDATDRISWVLRGSNGEWNGSDLNGNGFGFLNPTDPNHRILATTPPSLIGIAIADSGPFAPLGPTMYVANWLSGIRRWTLTGANLDTATPIPADGGQVFTADIVGTDLLFDSDGNLFTAWSNGGDSQGDFFTIWKVRFSGVDPPVAAFATSPAPPTGPAPLAIDFTDQSTAPGSAIADHQWQFGDGSSSNLPSPSHTYAEPDAYTARLTVRNSEGLQDSHEVLVNAFRQVQVTLNGTIFDGRILPAMALSNTTQLRFYQEDGTTPIAFPGGLGAQGNGLEVVNGVINGTLDLNLTANSFAVSAGEPTADMVAPAMLGITVPIASTSLTTTLEFYLSDLVIRGRVTDYGHMPVVVDLGLAKTTPQDWISVAGGRDFLPGSGFPATGFQHRRTSDPLGFFHLPIPTSQGNGTYFVQAIADTGADMFASQTITRAVDGDEEISVIVARYSGGTNCDDLSSIPETPDVDYNTQIQPIWDTSCTGCHNPTATNSGGLDLQPGASLANLVNAPSSFANGLLRVQAGHPNRSFLFEKINCEQPQVGNRMRPTNAMSLTEQALIRDWITQLNNSCLENFRNQLPNWPGISVIDLIAFVCP